MPFFDTFFKDKPSEMGLWLQTEKARQVLARIQQHQQVSRLLELGPGWGEFADLCMQSKIDYHSIEPNYIRATKLAERGISVILAQTPPIPARDGEFDVTLALNVLEHMPDFVTAIRFLDEMVRVTRPGGVVVINCPDLLATGKVFWDADYTHNFPVTMRRISQMFSDQKLEIIDSTYYSGIFAGPIATPVSWMAQTFPEQLVSYAAQPFVHADRIHRFRLTFYRNIFVIGRKAYV
jgi:SAM-dependent methyltransferase